MYLIFNYGGNIIDLYWIRGTYYIQEKIFLYIYNCLFLLIPF